MSEIAATRTSKLVRVEVDRGLARITLNRPEARNALSRDLIRALGEAVKAVQSNEIRVVILGGEGKSFCAGMDLKAVAADPIQMGEMLRDFSRVLRVIRRLPVPTIAQVQGAAIGGGCGLMVVCDFAFTHEDAKLGYPEVDLGVCPAVVAPWLVKKIGTGPARSMLLAGGTITGREGFDRGLATNMVKESELAGAVTTFALALAKGGPNALAATKRLLNDLDGSNDDSLADQAAEISAKIVGGVEAQERLKRVFGG